MIPRRRLSSFAALVALVLAGCGSEAPEEKVADRSTTPTTASRSADTGGATSELLAFKAPAIGGGQVDAAVFQGRPTLLWFWAPW